MLDVLKTIGWCIVRRLIHGPATEEDVAALRHQVLTLQRQIVGRPKLTVWDRVFFAAVYEVNPRQGCVVWRSLQEACSYDGHQGSTCRP